VRTVRLSLKFGSTRTFFGTLHRKREGALYGEDGTRGPLDNKRANGNSAILLLRRTANLIDCGHILTIYVRLAQAVRIFTVTQRVEILPG